MRGRGVLNPWLFPVAAFLFGAVIGSFLNVVIRRLPLGESIVFPGSHCPLCGDPIRATDNIPILSWLLLRGRCRSCREPIPVRYPLVELSNALLWTALLHRFGPGLPFAVFAPFSSALLAVTLIDLDHQIIPDAITLPGIPLGLAASLALPSQPSALTEILYRKLGLAHLPGVLASPGFWDSVLAAAAGFFFFYAAAEIGYRVFRKESMGGGDIKLAAMMGAFLGFTHLVVAIYVALLAGSAVGVALLLLRRARIGSPIPFGPFLAFGGIVSLFTAERIIGWYLQLSGY
jgi:leader peptidase (prepilin peptidase)/N-methyltransferase